MDSKAKDVETYYNAFSHAYDKMYKKIQLEKYQHVKEYIDEYENKRVLDLGGGTGLFSEWIKQECINLDISIEMLRIGLTHNRANLSIQADLEALPFRDNVFSHIVSFTAVQNSRNPDKVIREVVRISMIPFRAIITVLKKKTTVQEMNEFYQQSGFDYELIPFSGEDYIHSISRSRSSSSGS